jgi:peptide/nickel transport system substrate-binding protein
MKRNFLSLACLCLAFFMIAGCGNSTSSAPAPATPGGSSAPVAAPQKTDIVLANNAAPTSVDPQEVQDTTTISIFRQMYSRLIKQDNELNYVGDLATDWKFTSDTALEFTIRDDAYFSDGTQIKASDVKFTIERAQASPRVKQFVDMITEIEIIDDFNLVLHTEAPCGPLLSNLCHTPASIVSEKYVTEMGDNAFVTPVTSGALALVENKVGDYLKFVPNEHYFDRDKVKLTSLTWRIIPEGSARTIALETGEVDIVLNLDAIDANKVEENANLTLYSNPSNQIEYMALNMKEGSVFADQKVREALNYAVDKESVLIVACEGRGEIANSVLLPSLPGYVDYAYEYNPEKAKALLKEAGYDESNPLTFVIKTSGAARVREAEMIQANMLDIGAKVSIETIEWATFLDETMKGNFDAYIMGINFNVGDTDFLVDGFFHSRQIGISSNRFAFRNDRVDELATLGKTIVDAAKRENCYREAVSIIVESYPWVPLFTKHYLAGVQKDLKGYTQHPLFMEDYYLLHY